MPENTIIPEKYHILSGSALKLLAMICMVIDHIAAYLIPGDTTVIMQVFGHTLTLYRFMRLVGRIAFPIFAFLLVEGFKHTHDRKKYGMRLLLFALLSEIPWDLASAGRTNWGTQNIFFTLFLGYLAMCVLDGFYQDSTEMDRIRKTCCLVGLLAVSIFFRVDYGCSGLGFILMMYLLRKEPVFRAILSCCILSSRWRAGLSAIPISLYNGKRGFIQGKPLQMAFYAVYPLHLLVLYVIRVWF